MKIPNKQLNIAIGPLFVMMIYFTVISPTTTSVDDVYIPMEEVIEDVDEILPVPPVAIKTLNDFKYDLGFKESSNRYTAVNPWGYLGRYQFSPNILWRLGFKVSREEFLNNPDMQEEAFETLLYHNYDILKSTIDEYSGTTVNGIEITKSGILAAAHLVGPTRTKLFLKYERNHTDGLGTHLTDYMEQFGGYTLQL